MRKYEQWGRKMAAEHLYAHFFGLGHKGFDNVRVIIIDKTNIGISLHKLGKHFGYTN